MTLGFIGEGHVGQRNVIARIPLHLAAVNVWSLGVIFFYMLSGYHPFSDALSTSENANCKRFATCPVRFFLVILNTNYWPFSQVIFDWKKIEIPYRLKDLHWAKKC
jgi:serine/threonine protein kinase